MHLRVNLQRAEKQGVHIRLDKDEKHLEIDFEVAHFDGEILSRDFTDSWGLTMRQHEDLMDEVVTKAARLRFSSLME